MWKALSYSARRLTRTPAASFSLLFTIALGIGSNASIDGFSRGLTRSPLPLDNLDALVSIFALDRERRASAVSYDDYLALKSDAGSFQRVGAVRETQATITLAGQSAVVTIAEATPELAQLFGLSFAESDAVISHQFWQTELASRDVVGQMIDGESGGIRIANVAPEWLEGLYVGRPVDVWMPLRDSSRRGEGLWVLAQLRDGLTVASARSALRARPGTDGLAVMPYTALMPDMADGLSRIAALLRAAAAALFIVAAANVASFVLTRASTQSPETAVRVAVGARRTHLLAHVAADSVLISLGGGVLGVLLATWTKDLVPSLFFDTDAEQLFFDPDVVSSLGVSALCAAVTILCGLLPIVDLRHDKASAVLQRNNAGQSRTMRRFCDGLVAIQMATCCVLIVGTGLLFHGLRSALETYEGQRLGQTLLLTAQSPAFDSRFQTMAHAAKYFAQVQDTTQSMPDIVQSAWSSGPPGSRPRWQSIRADAPDVPRGEAMLNFESLTPAALARLSMPPIAGRMFGAGDTEGCPSVVVDVEAAAVMFDKDALGRVIEDPGGQRLQIIGIVRRHPAATTPHVPTVYYDSERYPDGQSHRGLARFRVPIPPAREANGVLDSNVVSPSYFDVLGLPLSSGRLFPESEAPGCRIGVLNEEAAERYFPGGAIGGAVIDGSGLRTEIVGVVRSPRLRTAQRGVEPTIYLPMSQDVRPRMTLLARGQVLMPATLQAVATRVNGVAGGKAPIEVTTLDAYLRAGALAPERIAATLVGASTVIALGLGILGLYGSMSDAVRRRNREFALRVALGAPGSRIASHVLAEGARLVVAGTVGGTLLSLVVARSVTRVTPTADQIPIWVWMAAPAILCGAVLLAALVPAWRAQTIDPLILMRDK